MIKSPLVPARVPINVVVITFLFNVIRRAYDYHTWVSAWALTIILFLVILCLVEYYYHLKDYLRERYYLHRFTQMKRHNYLGFRERVKSGRVWHFEAEAESLVRDEWEVK